MRFSFIIPVYNRPEEVDELLESLSRQTWRDFQVIIVEDGSSRPCEEVIGKYSAGMDIRYVAKENTGQGFSRNRGFEEATGDVWILMDSDCIAPPTYLEQVERGMRERGLDAFGGPDMAHESFTDVQKAIDYAMTSFFTTGGIRNRADGLDTYLARSFNMGFRREVIEKVGGFVITRKGEDLELSVRIIKAGFRMGLLPEAYVYHKRRADMRAFARQLFFFGQSRINLWRFHRDQLRWVHLLPSAFLLDAATVAALWIWVAVAAVVGASDGAAVGSAEGAAGGAAFWLAVAGTIAIGMYSMLLWSDARRRLRSARLATMALTASWIQLLSYGAGMIREWIAYARQSAYFESLPKGRFGE